MVVLSLPFWLGRHTWIAWEALLSALALMLDQNMHHIFWMLCTCLLNACNAPLLLGAQLARGLHMRSTIDSHAHAMAECAVVQKYILC